MKIIINALLTISIIIIVSCSEEDKSVTGTEKYALIDVSLSQIPSRIQFGKDINYFFRIYTEDNYHPSDSLIVSAFLINGDDSLNVSLYDDGITYDDGVTDDPLRCDLAASNGIWSGGVNALDILSQGEWHLKLSLIKDNSSLLFADSSSTVIVRSNSKPEITAFSGLSDNDSLVSGFNTRNISVTVNDEDNDEAGYNDDQTIKLEVRNRYNIPKDYFFERPAPMADFNIQIDSTLASGLKTDSNYDMIFIATDLYGESDSLSFSGITIENGPPEISGLTYTDTVYVPVDSTLYVDFSVEVRVDDPQGHLEDQDVDSVNIITNSTRQMYDDGNDLDEEKNDGIYTAAYTMNSTFFSGDEAELPFIVTVRDKAGNQGNSLSGKFIFIKYSKEIQDKNYREYNDKNKYINPFICL